jgi:uncharacterized protein YydD (DUF2326 family)
MRLIELQVFRGDKTIRTVKFKTGLNLILDAPTDKLIQSGNNIGKTTTLRLIDFCLGSEGDDIWQDGEFKKKINQEVYDFLHGIPRVSVSLKIGDPIRGSHVLTRFFLSGKKDGASFLVDDDVKSNVTEYRAATKRLLFGSAGAKPTLRQLLPKFVRSSPAAMSRTLKFLEFTSDVEYEAIHLFLFGFFNVDVLEERPRLTRKRKTLLRDIDALSRTRKEGEIEQLLLHLRREIEDLTLANELRGEVPEIAERADAVTAVRAKAANVAGELGRLEGEIAAIAMTIDELSDGFSKIDRETIEAIYREAQRYIPKLQHDWNELSNFVHNLRGRKQRFLETRQLSLSNSAEAAKERLEQLQAQERSQLAKLMESREFAQALELRADLQEKLKRLGSLEQDLQDIRDLKRQIEDVEELLHATQAEIEKGKAQLGERVATFNKHFSELSKALYGEQYLLHFDETEKGSLVFQLSSVGSNVGSGKKASQTAAFDLAYIEFLRDAGINFPKFVCHDGIESIHGNQLTALLERAAQIDGQLIIATLRDKLPVMARNFVVENTILELSQDGRLFGL